MKKGQKIFTIASSTITGIILIASIVAMTTPSLSGIISSVFGGSVAVYKESQKPLYESKYTSKEEVYNAANDFNSKVCEEGFVLLKNNSTDTQKKALPLSKGSRVSVFGKNSVNLAYSGSGSAGSASNNAKTIYDSLQDAGFETNSKLKEFYKDESLSGKKREGNSSDLDGGQAVSIATGETPQSKYTDEVKNSYSSYSDAALIVITRIGGEGFDLPLYQGDTTGAKSRDSHYLQLDKNEEDMVNAVCAAGFKHVIVVFNIPSSFEAGFLLENDGIDAAIWTGYFGDSGIMALGKILNGDVNPSGKLVDTWARDFKKDPVFQNFGSGYEGDGFADRYDLSTNGLNSPNPYYFVDYEEGIYVGYRYYETRGQNEGEDWYRNQVVYPFGYGLSYSDFEWTVDDSSLRDVMIEKGKTYDIKVTVKNVGSVAGKDVVELYGHAPYFDAEIEKPYEQLVDFKKTKLLDPGESEKLTLTFDPYYLASYDYGYDGGDERLDNNGNGFLGYELDEGDYSLFVSHSAHDTEATIPFKSTNIQYPTDPITGNEVKNRFSGITSDINLNSDAHLVNGTISRSDWEGTFPAKPTAEEKVLTAATLATLADVSTNNPTDYSSAKMPSMNKATMVKEEDGTERTLQLKDMIGAEYDDPRWEQLLDEMSYDEMSLLFESGAFKTEAIDSIGKPLTNETDGPSGFTNFMLKDGTYWKTCHYCSEPVIASTYNTDLIEELGEMVGDEGIIGANGKGNGLPYSGWYAPGVNLHRSPFGGRNQEYFSEDPLLSGKMGAAEVRGCQKKGVFCYVKHFVGNEQETHRSVTGDCSWVTEQALRELYLRPFEIIVKEGKAHGIMSSFNRIGTKWTGGDYRLLTEILRNEWGFQGTVISDFNTCPHMNTRQMAYAGGDLDLVSFLPAAFSSKDNAGDVIMLRRASKNILFTAVNSNAFNGEIDHYRMANWKIVLLIINGVLILVTAVGIAFILVLNHQKKSIVGK